MKAFLEWGIKGVDRAVRRGDVIVIVDVLRFTSAAVTAVSNGFTVIPARDEGEAGRLLEEFPKARLNGTGLAVLSPKSFVGKKPGEVVLPSPHGAALSCRAAGAKNAFVGSLLNAASAAETAGNAAGAPGSDVTIIASGELGRERAGIMPEFERRLASGNAIFCFEDYVGAGAISSKMKAEKNGELLSAEKAFRENSGKLAGLFPHTASGQFLKRQGFADDVQFCASCDIFTVTPRITKRGEGAIIAGDRVTEKTLGTG